MEEKNSLNNKYQKIDIDETPVAEETSQKPVKEKKTKEKKVKEPKQPKEKKIKEPKQPKVKKVKEPKPPKEKKVKEHKPSKPKKEKKAKEPKLDLEVAKEITPETITETQAIPTVTEAETKSVVEKRRTEEVVLPVVKQVKKVKAPKQPKEKKVKEPKPPKEKKVKEPKQPKEKKPREPLTKKDFLTIAIAILAFAMVISIVLVKYLPESDLTTESTESTTTPQKDGLASVQVARDGVITNLIQSDIPDVFYGFTTDYKLRYYQYINNKMTGVQSTGSVKTSIDLGNETIPVTIDYVELGDKLFGSGIFVAKKGENVYFYDMVIFQLVNLPKGYEQEGKALLLATTSKNALTQRVALWPESFVVDLKTGKTSRFLKTINRNIDMTTGAGVDDFCILTKEGYTASESIPFISAREYETDSGKQDIFVKNGNKETVFASDVYGKYLLTDGNAVIFLRRTDKGFDVVRKIGEEEKVTATFFGDMNTNYLRVGKYIFNKNDGKLYNLKTGTEKLVVGYRMSAEMISVSPDGKYLVMLGTVTNMMDYQVHIFNLETGEYAKFEDANYSNHSNLTFINNTTAVYMVLDPNQGYEYVVLDVSKVK